MNSVLVNDCWTFRLHHWSRSIRFHIQTGPSRVIRVTAAAYMIRQIVSSRQCAIRQNRYCLPIKNEKKKERFNVVHHGVLLFGHVNGLDLVFHYDIMLRQSTPRVSICYSCRTPVPDVECIKGWLAICATNCTLHTTAISPLQSHVPHTWSQPFRSLSVAIYCPRLTVHRHHPKLWGRKLLTKVVVVGRGYAWNIGEWIGEWKRSLPGRSLHHFNEFIDAILCAGIWRNLINI